MKKIKTYGFWTAFAGAVIVFLNALGDVFGFHVESELIKNLIMAFAGVLVAVGVVSMGNEKKEDGGEQAQPEDATQDEPLEQVQEKQKEEQTETSEEESKN